MDRPAAPPRAGLTESLSRLRDRNRAACASNPPRPAHGDENAPAQESVRASEKHPAERASSFGDAVSRARTPGGSAETGARLAALKALRSQSRPASGRRAVASPTARDGARVLVPSEDHARASTSNRDAEDASEIASAAERRLAAVAISNEWREFDGHDTRPERSESAATSNASASLSSAATSNASASSLRRSPRGAPPLAPKEPTPVIIVTARGPPGAPSSASCSPSPDGGAVLTLARPKTSITRSFRIGARVGRPSGAFRVSRKSCKGRRRRRGRNRRNVRRVRRDGGGGCDARDRVRALRVRHVGVFRLRRGSGRRRIRGEDGFGAKDRSGSGRPRVESRRVRRRRGHSVRRRRARSTGRRRRGTNLRAGARRRRRCPRRLRARSSREGRRTRCSATSSPKDSTR